MNCRIFQVGAAAILLAVTATAVQPQETTVKFVDQKPPKYEYGYIVSDKEGNAQGHVQSRDGVFALGRYYVNAPDGSGQKVTYFADDWGYHPLVSYGSTSPKGSSRTQFAMGDKAIAALKDNAPVGNAITVSSTPSFTSISLNAAAQQPSLLLAPPTIPTNLRTPSGSVIPTFDTRAVTSQVEQKVTPKQTILHIPELRQALQAAAGQGDVNNSSQLVNLTAEIGSIGRGNVQEIIRLSSFLQPPDNTTSSYNSDFQTVQEQLTEDQRQNLYASPTANYLTTTMKPIVIPGTESNAIVRNSGQIDYNGVDSPSYGKNGDSASQSTNSIAVNQPDNAVNVVDQLAPLQAGISILSSEGAKPVQESVPGEQISYKTVVDIQEGISLDVKQNPDGTIHLNSNYGERIPKQKTTQIQALGYERRLVNPIAQDIVRETDPIRREQKQADLLARQEAEILEVQKSIEQLQEQIISQIDAEHSQQEKKQKTESKVEDQNSIQSSNTHIQVAAAPQVETIQYQQVVPDPVPTPVVIAAPNPQPQVILPPVIAPEKVPVTYSETVDRESVGNNQVEILPHRTVKSQNLAGILTLNAPTQLVQVDTEKEIVDLVPPPVTHESEPVLVEPYPIEEEPKLLPASPSPTLFPVKVETPVIIEKPTLVETTKIVEKPVVVKEPVEHTKVVEVEKEVPVPQPYPVEVTKYVHVDRPVPVPHPIPVSHPVPVPVAVPHPVEVPVPHLIPVPEILPIAVKEYYPIYIHKTKYKEARPPKPEKHITSDAGVKPLFKPNANYKHIDLQTYLTQHGGDLQFSDHAIRPTFHEDTFRGHHRNKNVLRNLRIEYGFKPPLRPSVEITEEVKPSIYGPSVRSD